MRFAVLGPLTVTNGHGAMPVTGGMQRLLLAVLLSGNGKPLSVDALVDALWGDRPPEAPHKRLSWHIHRLRSSLDDADRVVRSGTGYALPIRPAELDLAEFTLLCRQAEAARTASDTAAAGDHWAEALRLWRGPAFGELGEHRVLRGEAKRLEQLRMRAVEQRIDADLELGRHDTVIGELTDLVAEHPLRERIRGQLMLALHRSGRQSEALDAYREVRRLRVEQLGLEPGRELRELHKEILCDAPRLAAPSASSAPRPAELPPGTTAFTGRQMDVDRLRQLLSGEAPDPVVISTVTGTGGIGKSALAIRSAHLVANKFPDGQLYLNLRGATPGATRLDPADALRRMLRSLD
ncbi:MAG: BTAD domain-containing putative transcriptional regulator, partial [Stackebrandtia sp.]